MRFSNKKIGWNSENSKTLVGIKMHCLHFVVDLKSVQNSPISSKEHPYKIFSKPKWWKVIK